MPKSWANLRSFQTPSGILIKHVDASTMLLTCPLPLEVARVSTVLATAYVAAYSVHTMPNGREKTKRRGVLMALDRFSRKHCRIGRLVDDCSTIALRHQISMGHFPIRIMNRPVDDSHYGRYQNSRGCGSDDIAGEVSPMPTTGRLLLIQDRLSLLHGRGSSAVTISNAQENIRALLVFM